MDVNLQENLCFGGKFWKCISAVTSTDCCYFFENEEWHLASKNEINKIHDFQVEGISLALYETIDFPEVIPMEKVAYIGNEIVSLRNRQDRHKDLEN